MLAPVAHVRLATANPFEAKHGKHGKHGCRPLATVPQVPGLLPRFLPPIERSALLLALLWETRFCASCWETMARVSSSARPLPSPGLSRALSPHCLVEQEDQSIWILLQTVSTALVRPRRQQRHLIGAPVVQELTM